MNSNWKTYNLSIWNPGDEICRQPVFQNIVVISNQRKIKETVIDLFTGYNAEMLDFHFKITKNTKGVERFSPTIMKDIEQWLAEHPVERLKGMLEFQDELDLPLLRMLAGGKTNGNRNDNC